VLGAANAFRALVHQLGERPRLTGLAGWGHLLLLAGLAAWWTSARDQARRDATG
jgi:hypothetical protein